MNDPSGTHSHSYKENFVTKKVFLLICLEHHSDICGKIFSFSFIHFFERFLIFHFKHVLKEVGRKVVTEPVFRMDSIASAEVCL